MSIWFKSGVLGCNHFARLDEVVLDVGESIPGVWLFEQNQG